MDAARRERQPYIWDTKYHWGEWLEPGAGDGLKMATGMIRRILLSEPLVATAYYAHSARLLAEIAGILGKEGDARTYGELADKIVGAYIAEFVGEGGRIRPDKQASYVRALALDLLPEDLRPAAVEHLVRLIREADTHLGTGFLSTPFLCHVLSENGQLDLAYELLNQDTVPSWLYAVTKGATTIWESWEGIKEDGTPQLSHNHYSYGAVGSWLYQVVAGIEIGAPGYKRIAIQPRPGGGLSCARATYRSMYGEITSAWEIADGAFKLSVAVPPNTTATVHLPGAEASQVTESDMPLSEAPGIGNVQQAPDVTVLEIGSGQYEFAYPWG
jgi:alpha-L-rhamnosidase